MTTNQLSAAQKDHRQPDGRFGAYQANEPEDVKLEASEAALSPCQGCDEDAVLTEGSGLCDDCHADTLCSDCSERYSPDGDGYDGRCPDCADVAEATVDVGQRLVSAGLNGATDFYEGDCDDIEPGALLYRHPNSEHDLIIGPTSNDEFAVAYEHPEDIDKSFRRILDEDPSAEDLAEAVTEALFEIDLNEAVSSHTAPEVFEVRTATLSGNTADTLSAELVFSNEGQFGYLTYNYGTGEASISDCDDDDLTADIVVADMFPDGSVHQSFDAILQNVSASKFLNADANQAITGYHPDATDDDLAEAKEVIFDADGGRWAKSSDSTDLNHKYSSVNDGFNITVGHGVNEGYAHYAVWDNTEPGVSREIASGNGDDLEVVMAEARAKRSRAIGYGTNDDIYDGAQLPWGVSGGSERLLPGIDRVWSKGGHGAYKLTEQRNHEVHPAWRNEDGFYNEKVAWVIPTLTNHEEFVPTRVESALAVARKEYGPQLAQVMREQPHRYAALKTAA